MIRYSAKINAGTVKVLCHTNALPSVSEAVVECVTKINQIMPRVNYNLKVTEYHGATPRHVFTITMREAREIVERAKSTGAN